MENLNKPAMPNTSDKPEVLLRNDASKKRRLLQFLIDRDLAQRNEDGKIKITADWKNKDNRVVAIRGLLEILEIKPTDLTAQIFFDNGLIKLFMHNLHRNSNEKNILNLINDAYPKCDFHIWDLKHVSKSELANASTANQAIDWFVTKWCSVNYITRLTAEDFVKNDLSFAIEYYNNNIYVAIFNGYSGMSFDDWKLLNASHMNRKSIDDKLNRECVLNGLKRFFDSIYSIRYEDFEACGIGYVLDYYRSKRNENLSDKSSVIDGSLLVYDALIEMSPKNFDVWRMSNPPHDLFKVKANRIGAIKFIAYRTGKNISNLGIKDFESLGFRWLVDDFYDGDANAASIEALYGSLPS